MNLLNVAYYLPKLASVLGGQIAREEEWDFLKMEVTEYFQVKSQRIWNGCVKSDVYYRYYSYYNMLISCYRHYQEQKK